MAEYLSDLNYKGNVYRYIDLKKASALLGGDIKNFLILYAYYSKVSFVRKMV